MEEDHHISIIWSLYIHEKLYLEHFVLDKKSVVGRLKDYRWSIRSQSGINFKWWLKPILIYMRQRLQAGQPYGGQLTLYSLSKYLFSLSVCKLFSMLKTEETKKTYMLLIFSQIIKVLKTLIFPWTLLIIYRQRAYNTLLHMVNDHTQKHFLHKSGQTSRSDSVLIWKNGSLFFFFLPES